MIHIQECLDRDKVRLLKHPKLHVADSANSNLVALYNGIAKILG
jgi:hypothetical protein